MRALSLLLPMTLSILCTVGAAVARADSTPPSKRVALVFDDGPVPEQAAPFIALFAREGVKATFSHEGRFVAARPDLARAVLEAGHEIANHSYTHPHFKDMTVDAIAKELRDTQAALREATGREPVWVWTPFLEWNDTIAAAVASAGLRHFPLSQVKLVSSDDWNTKTDAAGILKNATTGIEDRTIILCHEWRAETLAQLPAILAELRKQGCTFLTFSELAATLSAEQRAVAH
jgi:peptidoglycan/xylan/chitin deacetylase (PgdA/CDA1 family)